MAAALACSVFLGAGCGRQTYDSGPSRGGYCPAPTPAYVTTAEVCPVPAAPAQVWRPIAGRTVILDAGHGGNDEGAAYFGLREKDINLDLALRTAALLRAQGVVVHMTRNSDVFIPLPDRSAFANRNPGAVFVSVHVNASERNPNATGIETFILAKDFKDEERSRVASSRFKFNGSSSAEGKQALANLTVKSRGQGPVLAKSLQQSLVAKLGEPDRGVKPGNLAVLRETFFCPAVLVEVGFMSNSGTAAKMRTEDWRRRTAEALADGIAGYLRQSD